MKTCVSVAAQSQISTLIKTKSARPNSKSSLLRISESSTNKVFPFIRIGRAYIIATHSLDLNLDLDLAAPHHDHAHVHCRYDRMHHDEFSCSRIGIWQTLR
ncbi:hypothetical protein CY34DRAFT_350736 [Suillus luteus UH-Slu-Lm8-n1]|uniref:Uncharacterized protein n=1 Tax=Suillus luteus UH-Slu-Lm8-n1 TaxID=930992 RepID=A0A0D0ABE4_9AGAM|nr:hypothetical protein CY34DRAFT_350736 [Suillus luteus UH-Slu-Lm8-n1]